MNRRDIYKELKLDTFFEGAAFEIEIHNEDISTEDKMIELLDRVSVVENLEKVGRGWNSLTFKNASNLLLNSLRYDLAYSSCEIIPEEKAIYFHKEILKGFDPESTYCFTNWHGSPWETSGGWDPLTESTFDLGVVFINKNKLAFVLHMSED